MALISILFASNVAKIHPACVQFKLLDRQRDMAILICIHFRFILTLSASNFILWASSFSCWHSSRRAVISVATSLDTRSRLFFIIRSSRSSVSACSRRDLSSSSSPVRLITFSCASNSCSFAEFSSACRCPTSSVSSAIHSWTQIVIKSAGRAWILEIFLIFMKFEREDLTVKGPLHKQA